MPAPFFNSSTTATFGSSPLTVSGISTRDADVLRAIQLRGSSSSGKVAKPFGKLWTVSEMVGLRVLDEPFTPNDPNYNPNDSAMKHIYCRIE